uniref:Twin-arginine translocation protein TatB n=1 Tax=uncultured bacterium A1Q1_fos_1880 TaxID=1256556 RepID=L7VZD4_9BACT|nr:twin-arginine translocation protein TatB [uncultured bacterium A1Q1_fos_1880]
MSDIESNALLHYTNGINASTGKYIDDCPWTADEIDQQAKEEFKRLSDKDRTFNYYKKHVDETKALQGDLNLKTWGVPPSYEPSQLDSVGWCVVIPENGDPEVLKRLEPLLQRRCTEAGKLYRVFSGADGYKLGETWNDFRGRHEIGLGLARPEKMPYYVLLVGSPEEIPFSFQYEMDVQRAVGRIYFDTPEEYACYAKSVIDAEEGKVKLPRRTVLFGTQNENDRQTTLSAENLIKPLKSLLETKSASEPQSPGLWTTDLVAPEQAYKPRLQELLGGSDTPALLFTATHGAGFVSSDSVRQRTSQGALVCQDWPGPKNWNDPLPDDFLFSACDVRNDANVWGMLAMFFACFSAGTPRQSDFIHRKQRDPREPLVVADQAFVSPLARRLLAHPNGGALALVGHIERAWPTSFIDELASRQPTVDAFQILLASLTMGHRLGYAMEAFNMRYAELSMQLLQYLYDKEGDASLIAGLWTANNDARNYVVIGDPAVRLAVAPAGKSTERLPFEFAYTQPIQLQTWCQEKAFVANPVTSAAITSIGDHPSLTTALQPLAVDGTQRQPNTQNQMHMSETTGKAAQMASSNVNIQSTSPDQAATMQVNRRPSNIDPNEDLNQPFLPLFEPPSGFDKEKYPKLYAAWEKHVTTGYEHFDTMFHRILTAFLLSHYSTVVMNWILFVVGVGFFIRSVMKGTTQDLAPAALFGGLSVITFLTYFISRPTQTVEENLHFITWLGLIYNSYWVRQLASITAATAQTDLHQITVDAIAQIQGLINRHAEAVNNRPSLIQRVLGRKKETEPNLKDKTTTKI